MKVNDDKNKPQIISFTADEMKSAIDSGKVIPIYEDEIAKEYHENGALKSEGIMGPNAMQGYWKYYYEDGTLEAEKNFKDGKEHGYCKWYLMTGELRTFEVWDEGIRTDCKIYYKSGAIEEKISYNNGIPSYIKLFHENGNVSKQWPTTPRPNARVTANAAGAFSDHPAAHASFIGWVAKAFQRASAALAARALD